MRHPLAHHANAEGHSGRRSDSLPATELEATEKRDRQRGDQHRANQKTYAHAPMVHSRTDGTGQPGVDGNESLVLQSHYMGFACRLRGRSN
jgi:hypothetical protein